MRSRSAGAGRILALIAEPPALTIRLESQLMADLVDGADKPRSLLEEISGFSEGQASVIANVRLGAVRLSIVCSDHQVHASVLMAPEAAREVARRLTTAAVVLELASLPSIDGTDPRLA